MMVKLMKVMSMITIRFLETTFNIEMDNEDFYRRIFKEYLIDSSSADYHIIQTHKMMATPDIDPIIRSNYFDLYQTGEHFTQIQYDDDKNLVGGLSYDNQKVAYLYTVKENSIDLEYLLLQYLITYYIMEHQDAILMHGSSIKYLDKGFIFTAPSGTGKSTHTKMWVDQGVAEHINDDKNLVVLKEGKLYLYGNPFSGKHHRDHNIVAPLEAVIFVEQAPVNEVSKIKTSVAFYKIMRQLVRPNTSKEAQAWDKVTHVLFSLPYYVLKCDPTLEAYKVMKETMDKDFFKGD